MEKTNKFIEISPEEEAILKKIREDKVKELEAQLAIEKGRLARLSGKTTANLNLFPQLPPGYDKKMSLPKKMIFILKNKNKVMTAREVYDRLIEIEPSLKDEPGSYTTFNYVSSGLSGNSKNGVYFGRFSSSSGQYLYGLLEWFNEDRASVKDQYK